MNNRLQYARTIAVEHLTIPCVKSFDDARACLEAQIPPVDRSFFDLLRAGESERALRAMENGPPLSIFSSRDHGALLVIAGLRRRAVQYDIGNQLTASKMTRHQLPAALYAPVRVLLREDEAAEVAFEYDRPTSVFGQFGNNQVDAIAQELDRDLRRALEEVANS